MINLFNMVKKYKTIAPLDAKARLKDKNVLLVDVRTPDEYISTRIPNSISLPLDRIINDVEKVIPNKDTEIIVYCLRGGRASSACNLLSKMGYTNVSNLGGIMDWPYETASGK